ncbi:MAG: hypothetical protein ACSHWQ_07720, partial [Spongiibacteraceae bacterium]
MMAKRWLLYVSCLVFCSPVFAHKLAPSLLEVRQFDDANIEVFWRTPVESASLLTPVFPERCHLDSTGAISVGSLGQEQRFSMSCEREELSLHFSVNGLVESGTVAMLRWQPVEGESQTFLLNAQAP